jgi:hypothetical protein
MKSRLKVRQRYLVIEKIFPAFIDPYFFEFIDCLTGDPIRINKKNQ